MTKFIAQSGAT